MKGVFIVKFNFILKTYSLNTNAAFAKFIVHHGGVLLLVKLQAKACKFTKSNTPPWLPHNTNKIICRSYALLDADLVAECWNTSFSCY